MYIVIQPVPGPNLMHNLQYIQNLAKKLYILYNHCTLMYPSILKTDFYTPHPDFKTSHFHTQ